MLKARGLDSSRCLSDRLETRIVDSKSQTIHLIIHDILYQSNPGSLCSIIELVDKEVESSVTQARSYEVVGYATGTTWEAIPCVLQYLSSVSYHNINENGRFSFPILEKSFHTVE